MKYLITTLLLTLFISCSKNSTPDTTENSCNKILEVLDYHPNGSPTYQTTATLTYNSDGKIKTVTGQGLNNSEYTYYNDSIVLKAKDINGVDIGQVYYLNNQHRITRTKFANEEYQYNADDYLISYKQPYGNNGQIFGYTQYYLTWQNGNLTTVYTNDPNVSRKKVTFQYYNLPNQNLLGYNSPFYDGSILYDRNSFFLLGGLYFGKQPKDLLKSSNLNDINQSGDIIYQSDSNGRIIDLAGFYKFKYQCP